MDWIVPLADLDYGRRRRRAVLDVLRSHWLTMGAVTQAFEEEFAAAAGAKHALAVSNATEALHLACLALGIGPGDEVIMPSLSFVATSNAVLYSGADVRFADIHRAGGLDHRPERDRATGHTAHQGHHRDALRRISLPACKPSWRRPASTTCR